jgi:hypothetical protein
MTDIGNPVDLGGFNTALGDAAVTQKTSAMLNEAIWEWISSLGPDQASQEAALESRFSVDAPTAANMWLYANYLHALAGVYLGTVTQGSLFNFDSALAPVRGIN